MYRWHFITLDLVKATLEFQPGAPHQIRCWKISFDASGVPTQTPGNEDRMRALLQVYVDDEDETQEGLDDEGSGGEVCEQDDYEAIEPEQLSFPDHGAAEPQEDAEKDDDAGDQEDTARFPPARTMSCG